jgi:hypothetical protein
VPITAPIEVRAGDPTVQVSGQHRGTIKGTFDDGRIVERNIRGADLAGWDAKVAAAPAEMEEQMMVADAGAAVSPDEDVAPSGEATIEQTAIAYLRDSWRSELASDAYLLFDRFNTYVTNSQYTWDDVHTHLIAHGLTQEEWDQMKAAYQYLNGGTRPADMAAGKTIQDAWESQH